MDKGRLQKQILLIGILALLIIPQLVSGGITGTADITGNIIQAPVARFTANITGGYAPLVVQFTDMSDRDPASWNWDFGNGITSTLRNLTHTYTSGIYTVNLTVSNAAGNSTQVSFHYITVFTAQAGSPQVPSSSPGGSSGGGFLVPGLLSPPAQVIVPEQNPPGGVQRAPVQVNLGSQTIDLSPYS